MDSGWAPERLKAKTPAILPFFMALERSSFFIIKNAPPPSQKKNNTAHFLSGKAAATDMYNCYVPS